MLKTMALLFRILALLTLGISPALALFPQGTQVQFKLISESETITSGEPFWVAAQFTMDPGWHIYWKNPGDSGLPTTVEWDLPEGFKISEILWPSPKRFDFEGLVSYGYKESLTLITQVTPPKALKEGEAIHLTARASWLACETVCIPGKKEQTLKLTASKIAIPDDGGTRMISAALGQLPKELPDNWTAKSYRDGEKITLILSPKELLKPHINAEAYFFTEGETIDPQAQQLVFPLEYGGILLKITPKKDENLAELEGIFKANFPPFLEGVTLTVPVESTAPIAAGESPTEALALPKYNLLSILGFAFIGGMILNLMPCVFPVLGIKVLSFVKKSDSTPWKVKAHGGLFTLGVLVAFWILTAILLSMKAAGEEIGWGFQLQHPPFVAALTLLLWLMALNFVGVYEAGSRLMGAGQTLTTKDNFSSSFFSGILATVVATPCTAPFMGTAIGFAITQPILATVSIFTSMGLGMATPYLLLSLFPALIRHLPKPGAWMETFKAILSFPLFASVIWLLWVFGRQTDVDALTELLSALLIAAVAVWIFGHWVVPHKRISVQRRGIALTSLLLATSIVVGYKAATPDSTENELTWEPYSEQRLDELRAEHRMVFVDFTAAWCLTCQVNKRTSLRDERVITRFKKLDVALLLADWTEHDPEITEALEKLKRNGVPVYALYPEDPEKPPVLLPEILTPTIVLDALEDVYLNR